MMPVRVFRVITGDACPLLTITDLSAGRPEDWVRGVDVPAWCDSPRAKYRVLDATIDRLPRRREFCAVVPGTLALAADAFEDASGLTSMYYALWWEQRRIDLSAGGADYACIVPKLTLEPDPRSGAPCRIDGVFAAVFRIAGRPPTEIYCTSGIASGGEEFHPVYESEGFQGLGFELVWEGEPGEAT